MAERCDRNAGCEVEILLILHVPQVTTASSGHHRCWSSVGRHHERHDPFDEAVTPLGQVAWQVVMLLVIPVSTPYINHQNSRRTEYNSLSELLC